MHDHKETEPDRPDDDEPLSLAPSEDEPSRPKPFFLEDAPEDDDPILLIPVEEEPSREIPPLKPLPEEPAPDLPPLFPTPVSLFTDPDPEPPEAPEAMERRVELREDEELREPPTLYPLDLAGLTGWLFGSVNALIWLTATAVLAVVLFCGYLLASVPWIGPTAQVLFAILGFFLVAAYPLDVLRSAIAGSPALPDWSDYGNEGQGRTNAAGTLVILAVCLLPGLILGSLLGRFFALPVLLVGWTVVPAALLLYSASGAILGVNPLRIRDALVAAGWRYVLAAAPGYAVLIAWGIVGETIWAPFISSLLFPAMIAAALVVGTLARENDRVGRRLLAIARASTRAKAAEEEE